MALGSKPVTAADWTARLRSDRVTDADRHAYEQWLDSEPKNQESAERLDQVWQSMEELEDDPIIQGILAAPQRQQRSGWQAISVHRLLAATLGLLSIVAASFLMWRILDEGDSYQTVSGEQGVFELADGSRIHLNVATRLEVALRADVRNVRLLQGQAFFDVAPDPLRPFVVTAGDKRITVLGTKFDVFLSGEDTRVTVIEGRVAVTSLDVAQVSTPPVSKVRRQVGQPSIPEKLGDIQLPEQTHRLELTAQDAIAWPRSAPPTVLPPSTAVSAVEAWLSGRVVFEKTPLHQAVAELDRYTPFKVRLAAAELGSTTVSGAFHIDRLTDVDSLIFALENSLPIVIEQRGDEIVLFAAG